MSKEIAKKEKTIVDQVGIRIKELQNNKEIFFPVNYSPENALKSAWLKLQDVVNRNKESVLTSLLTVINGSVVEY